MPSKLRVITKPDGLTIEDVYASFPAWSKKGQAAATQAGARDRAAEKDGRLVLTPRSAEACLMEGIDPDMLYERDVESFVEAGVDPAIVRMVSAHLYAESEACDLITQLRFATSSRERSN